MWFIAGSSEAGSKEGEEGGERESRDDLHLGSPGSNDEQEDGVQETHTQTPGALSLALIHVCAFF